MQWRDVFKRRESQVMAFPFGNSGNDQNHLPMPLHRIGFPDWLLSEPFQIYSIVNHSDPPCPTPPETLGCGCAVSDDDVTQSGCDGIQVKVAPRHSAVPNNGASGHMTSHAAIKSRPRTIGIYEFRTNCFTKMGTEPHALDHLKGIPWPDGRQGNDPQVNAVRLDSTGNFTSLRDHGHRPPGRWEMSQEINE
jgi:hypothetical protein